jgi:hypothetical protein
MNFTLAFIVAALVIILGVDFALILWKGYDHTISAVLYTFSSEYPAVSFGLGFILGHVLWPNQAANKALERKREP